MTPIYDDIEIDFGDLSGPDGNAFFIIGKARKAMKRAGKTNAEIKEFSDKAMSGDYNNVLDTCRKHFNCYLEDESCQ